MRLYTTAQGMGKVYHQRDCKDSHSHNPCATLPSSRVSLGGQKLSLVAYLCMFYQGQRLWRHLYGWLRAMTCL